MTCTVLVRGARRGRSASRFQSQTRCIGAAENYAHKTFAFFADWYLVRGIVPLSSREPIRQVLVLILWAMTPPGAPAGGTVWPSHHFSISMAHYELSRCPFGAAYDDGYHTPQNRHLLPSTGKHVGLSVFVF